MVDLSSQLFGGGVAVLCVPCLCWSHVVLAAVMTYRYFTTTLHNNYFHHFLCLNCLTFPFASTTMHSHLHATTTTTTSPLLKYHFTADLTTSHADAPQPVLEQLSWKHWRLSTDVIASKRTYQVEAQHVITSLIILWCRGFWYSRPEARNNLYVLYILSGFFLTFSLSLSLSLSLFLFLLFLNNSWLWAHLGKKNCNIRLG